MAEGPQIGSTAANFIMLNVRWYLSYMLSYSDLSEMASERDSIEVRVLASDFEALNRALTNKPFLPIQIDAFDPLFFNRNLESESQGIPVLLIREDN